MLSFVCDYSEGAHPRILERLAETNLVLQPGYGSDEYTRSAREKIARACGCPDAGVFFLTGGTQTNQTVISSLLQSWQGVIAAETGHIAALYLGQFLSPLIVTPLGALCFGADDLLSPFKAGVIIGVVYLLQAWLTRKKKVVE